METSAVRVSEGTALRPWGLIGVLLEGLIHSLEVQELQLARCKPPSAATVGA